MPSTQENMEAIAAPILQMSLEEIAQSCGFDFVKALEEGSFGRVMVVKKRDGSSGAPGVVEPTVMKVVKKPRADKELNIHKLLGSHDNIIHFLESFEIRDTDLGLQLEMMTDDLHSLIHNKDTPFPRSLVKPFFRQMVKGLEHMHSLKIAHLDVKPENMFVTGDRLKIGDFGLSLCVKKSNGSGLHRVWGGSGTDPYRSPQLCFPNFRADAFPCDVWALGLVLIYMMAKDVPWNCSRIIDPKYKKWVDRKLDSRGTVRWNRMSENLIDLLRKMLSHHSAQRATLDDVKEHSWLLGNDDEEEHVEIVAKENKVQKKNKKRAVAPSPPDNIENEEASERDESQGPSNQILLPDQRLKRNRMPTEESIQPTEQQSPEDCSGRGKRVRQSKRQFELLY